MNFFFKNFPKPTIAQIHGYCSDSGCFLQLLSDISVATEDAVLGHPIRLWGEYASLVTLFSC